VWCLALVGIYNTMGQRAARIIFLIIPLTKQTMGI
jgi:hypothetical protein